MCGEKILGEGTGQNHMGLKSEWLRTRDRPELRLRLCWVGAPTIFAAPILRRSKVQNKSELGATNMFHLFLILITVE